MERDASTTQQREQKIRLIVAMSWLGLIALVTGYLLIEQSFPVRWLMSAVSDDEGYYSTKVVAGIVFIAVAAVTFPLTLLAGNLLDRVLRKK
ncbi:hypothetical protein EBS80_03955 [bacterium]|nr:hypothetical protein [bacterium]